MNMELEQRSLGTGEFPAGLFSERSESLAEQLETGDLFQFLQDVSGFLAKKDLPA